MSTHKTKTIRISLRAWELLRRMAFKSHEPMSKIIEAFIHSKKA